VNTEEIVKLSRRAVVDLIESRLASGKLEPFAGHERRKSPRWPFPGQVEVRLADDDHSPPSFFDCRDLSETGMGMCGEHAYEVGTIIDMSLHVPEVTFYGRAVVRYSMRMRHGQMMGVEFIFDE
jgi:hypothetical protein